MLHVELGKTQLKNHHMINVKFFTTLRLLLKVKEIDVDIGNSAPLGKVLKTIEDLIFNKTSLRFLEKLVDENGTLKRGTIVLLNGQNVLHAQALDTIVNDNDTLVLFPPGGGG